MKQLFAVFCILSLCQAVPGGTNDVERQRRYERTGGVVAVPGKGAVRIVNGQSVLSRERIAAVTESFGNIIKVKVETVAGEFDFASANRRTSATVYLVSRDDLPVTIYAPEAKYAVVNVRGLTAAQGEKAFLRGLWTACGAYRGYDPKDPLSQIDAPADLDALAVDSPVFTDFANMINSLEKQGITTERNMTYRRACQEGLAPAPTNDVQQAIWDKVRATPKNPMKIEFDPQKGR